jgi:hypothetical protein
MSTPLELILRSRSRTTPSITSKGPCDVGKTRCLAIEDFDPDRFAKSKHALLGSTKARSICTTEQGQGRSRARWGPICRRGAPLPGSVERKTR